MAQILEKNYSINFDNFKRPNNLIKFIILHYTGMKSENDSISRLKDHKSKVSSHYFIKNNGKIIELVPERYIAWHAGKSSWKKLRSLNKSSIGIEIQNPGHDHRYKSFNKKQIKSLINLLKNIKSKYNISNKNILGHSDIAPERKKDPGEKFPWKYLSKFNLAIWHNINLKKCKETRNMVIDSKDRKIFLNNLYKIGYSKIYKYDKINNLKLLTIAFQRRFRQELVNGIVDKECLLISDKLKKY